VEAKDDGIVRVVDSTVRNMGGALAADGGVLELSNSSVTGGTLLATDRPTAFVQFSGDVTLDDVRWIDRGRGEFRVYSTSTRLLGDFATRLPTGDTLVVDATDAPAELLIGGPELTNDGTIILRGADASAARLRLGNFHPVNSSRAIMEHVLEWKLIHRTEEDLHRLLAASKFGRPCTKLRFEAEGVNLFAECVKKSHPPTVSRSRNQ
jgi:hypothetical protein